MPGDPDVSNSILSAVPAFGGITVSWNYPSVNSEAVAHTLLFRGASADFNSALQLAVVTGDRYFDRLDANQTYYYWIRIVSVHGTVGDLIGPASATSRPLIADLLEQLTGQIDAGVLAQSLKQEIDRITLNAQAITNEAQARSDADGALSLTVSQVQAQTDDLAAAIQQEVTARTDATGALAQQIDTVQAQSDDQLASVQQTLQAEIDTVTGKVNAVWSAKVSVDGLIGGFGLVNDGTEVEAGFDVDKFWIGRTQANKRKPFMVVNGVVYMDDAVIRQLTFDKLTDSTGTFVVQNGKIQAQYMLVNNAAFSGDLWSTNWTGWGGAGWYLARSGTLYVNDLYARGNIQANSVTANSIVTSSILGGSVTALASITGASGSAVYIEAPAGSSALIILIDPGTSNVGLDGNNDWESNWSVLKINGTVIKTSLGTLMHTIPSPNGGYTIEAGANINNTASPPGSIVTTGITVSLAAMVTKR